jgi:hypothetical protein
MNDTTFHAWLLLQGFQSMWLPEAIRVLQIALSNHSAKNT